ncbi:MAG: phage portal protein [Firmicutes bacterium]|nr:phage portal protein [Bacillota bacterium]
MIQLESDYFDNLDEKKIQSLIKRIEPYINKRVESYDRYRRKQSPNQFMRSAKGKVLVAFENYIVNMAKGYLSGKAPSFSFTNRDNLSEQDFFEYAAHVKKVLADNDNSSIFADLIHDFLTTGATYLCIIENAENEIEYHVSSSRSTVVVYDYMIEPNPIAMLRFHVRDNEKFLEITTANERARYNEKGERQGFYDYEDGEIRQIFKKELLWNKVPVIPFEDPDGQSIFEPALELIDTYENLLYNMKNMTQYNDNAKLLAYGTQAENAALFIDDNDNIVENPAWQQEIQRLLQSPAVHLQDGADLKWLTKDVNYTGIIEILKHLEELISMTTCVPALTDEAFTCPPAGGAATQQAKP